MGDVQNYENPIMSIEEFGIGLLEKDSIPGLLLRSDENGVYSIGIQINDREVVKVDSVVENDAIEKIEQWKERIDEVRERYKQRETSDVKRET